MRKLLVASFLIAVAACGEGVQTTAPEIPDTPQPAFNFGNNPDAGPIIIRDEVGGGFGLRDSESGLQVYFMFDPVGVCTGPWASDLVDRQIVDVPDEANRIIRLYHGKDVTTSVWPNFGFNCGLFTTTTPLATGLSTFVWTDNDVDILFNPDSKNSNAYGWIAHGVLTDPGGAKAPFSALHKCVWDGQDLTTERCRNKIRLN
ncbi:MAG: hypothetical protein ACYSVY_17365 [Planctomycetota bacterium]